MTAVAAPVGRAPTRAAHPVRRLLLERVGLGVVTLFAVSVVVFAATQVLPGNAAYAVLGHSATPQRVHALEVQLGLDKPAVTQYWDWLTGLLTGHLGTSLANNEPVATLIGPRLVNSAALVVAAGIVGTLLGVGLGLLAAFRRDGLLDHALSVAALTVTSLPEFVVGIVLVILFAVVVSHVLPAVSVLPPGVAPWDDPRALVLPVATLVIVIIPYIFRMMRAATIEALESDYVEMAELKGLSRARILLRHALPNAIAPTIQVIGLNFLYLAGGIVIVEVVFDYPGIGQALVDAVSNRDIPTIQFIVVVLAAFYVVANILTDVVALLATPRRRAPR
jgi:peptide/nickel transport system permease protein